MIKLAEVRSDNMTAIRIQTVSALGTKVFRRIMLVRKRKTSGNGRALRVRQSEDRNGNGGRLIRVPLRGVRRATKARRRRF